MLYASIQQTQQFCFKLVLKRGWMCTWV